MHLIAKRNDFKTFLIEVLTQIEFGVVIKNYQVIHLSAASFRNTAIQSVRAGYDDLLQAQTLLFNWPAFGIVENYDKSLALFSAVYRDFLGNRALQPSHLNVSRPSNEATRPIENQLDSIYKAIGPEVYSLLEKANEYDMELYNSCLVKFEELWDKVLGWCMTPQPNKGRI